MMMNEKAKVIFVEGSDYSGKTTLISALTSNLAKEGKTYMVLKEPFGIYREILLNPNKKLSFMTRRILFMAGHIEVMNKITETVKNNNFDYIFIDRTSIISDWVYSVVESDSDNECIKILAKILDTIEYVDKNFFESFFKNNSSIIFLDASESTMKYRINERKINSDDINDIKSTEFKMKIYEIYHYLIKIIDTSYSTIENFTRFFKEYMILDNQEKIDNLIIGGIQNAIFIPFNKEKQNK